MIDLPYTLTDGVVAKKEGLSFDGVALIAKLVTGLPTISGGIMSWPDVAKRLRYREGEMWCGTPFLSDKTDIIVIYPSQTPEHIAALNWLAVIICDNAEAFRVLHDCIEEFGDE